MLFLFTEFLFSATPKEEYNQNIILSRNKERIQTNPEVNLISQCTFPPKEHQEHIHEEKCIQNNSVRNETMKETPSDNNKSLYPQTDNLVVRSYNHSNNIADDNSHNDVLNQPEPKIDPSMVSSISNSENETIKNVLSQSNPAIYSSNVAKTDDNEDNTTMNVLDQSLPEMNATQIIKKNNCQDKMTEGATDLLNPKVRMDNLKLKESQLQTPIPAVKGNIFEDLHGDSGTNSAPRQDSIRQFSIDSDKIKDSKIDHINGFLSKYFDNTISEDIFEIICERFNYDKQSIAVFLSHAIHNTSGFRKLVASGGDPYKSRGLVQVTGENNYKILGEPFYSNPDALSELSQDAVLASLSLYMHFVLPNSLAYLYDSLYFLNPEEVHAENFLKKEYQNKINGRKWIYCNICDIMGILPQFEQAPSFINCSVVEEE